MEAEEHVSPLSWIGVGTGARTVTTVVGQCRPAIQKKRTAPATAKHSIAAEFAGPPQTFGASKGHLDGRDDCAQSADGHMPLSVRRSSNAPTMGLKFELAWDRPGAARSLCAPSVRTAVRRMDVRLRLCATPSARRIQDWRHGPLVLACLRPEHSASAHAIESTLCAQLHVETKLAMNAKLCADQYF